MHTQRTPQAGNAPASLRSGMFQRCMWRYSAGALQHIRGLIEFAGIVASVPGRKCGRIAEVRFYFEKTIYFLSYMPNLRLRCDVIALEFTLSRLPQSEGFTMVEYGFIGPALTQTDSGAIIRVEIVGWIRPYGIPYAKTETGREYHISALHYWHDEPAPAVV